MSVIGSNILAGASGQGSGYNLTRSLRFRSSASAYLSRTLTASGSSQKFTWSGWVKRGAIPSSSDGWLFCSSNFNTSSNVLNFGIILKLGGGSETDTLVVGLENTVSGTNGIRRTTQVFRDPAAWYHIVAAVDTTQATASNRIKVYVNGSEVTSFAVNTDVSQNANVAINQSGDSPRIGAFLLNNSPQRYFDGYMTEVNFIDGQALTPSSFGETSTTTGVWIPKRYTGTYGTNGFYLPFSDNTSTTTLGYDKSGNSNNWTANNISLTTGSTYDSMTDVPTLTSATASNFCTWNPLDRTMERDTLGALSWSNGNLLAQTTQGRDGTKGTIWMPNGTGKYYFEITLTTGTPYSFGTACVADTKDTGAGGNVAGGGAGLAPCVGSDGGLRYNNSVTASWSPTFTNGDILSVAVDKTNGAVYFAKNGSWVNGSGGTTTFGSAANASTSGLADLVTPFASLGDNEGATLNCGQRPFAYTPPTGYVALNTFNLPTPTIGATASSRANKYFDILLYTGDGNSNRSLTGLNFQPDFVWNKARSNSYGHKLYDVIRGVTKQLSSNSSDAEATTGTANLVSFDSNGITIGNDTGFNGSGVTFVDWFWKANGSGISNTAGSISSTVSANTTSGFSVITYTGNGSAGATVGHGLGVAPRMLIIKARDGAGYSWKVYHASLGSGSHLELESTGASQGGIWNSTNPSSTVFTLGTNAGINENGKSYVCFAFANVNGYSKLDNYTGNGSSDGAFVHLGFRPRFVMTKRTNAISNWSLFDSARGSYNLNTPYLAANSNYLEETASIDFLSNGFKFRDSGATYNGSGDSYIYMAFAENPFKYSLAR